MIRSSILSTACIVSAFSLSACSSTLDRLEQVGKPPAMSQVSDPTQAAGYQPMTWPLPETKEPSKQYANSLWQPGSRAFFRDQRASRVGDILRVKIKIKDQAQVGNETERKRNSADSVGIPNVFGVENRIARVFNRGADPDKLIGTSSDTNTKGTGKIRRQDIIDTQVAAIVMQVLPNGNFVISGKEELRVNFELREVSVKGVVRPQDINSDNTIDSTQVAEARIVYGGQGQLTDVQQPRWGSQVIDAISPF